MNILLTKEMLTDQVASLRSEISMLEMEIRKHIDYLTAKDEEIAELKEQLHNARINRCDWCIDNGTCE